MFRGSYAFYLDFISFLSSRDGRVINDVKESELLEQAEIVKTKGLTNIAIIGICMSAIMFVVLVLNSLNRLTPGCRWQAGIPSEGHSETRIRIRCQYCLLVRWYESTSVSPA